MVIIFIVFCVPLSFFVSKPLWLLSITNAIAATWRHINLPYGFIRIYEHSKWLNKRYVPNSSLFSRHNDWSVWSLGVHKNFSRFLSLVKTKKGVVVFDETEPLKEVSHFRGNIKIASRSIKILNIITTLKGVVTKLGNALLILLGPKLWRVLTLQLSSMEWLYKQIFGGMQSLRYRGINWCSFDRSTFFSSKSTYVSFEDNLYMQLETVLGELYTHKIYSATKPLYQFYTCSNNIMSFAQIFLRYDRWSSSRVNCEGINTNMSYGTDFTIILKTLIDCNVS